MEKLFWKRTNKVCPDEIESLKVYGNYLDLFSYIEMIWKNFKSKRFVLIHRLSWLLMNKWFMLLNFYNNAKKLGVLDTLDVKFKMLKVLVWLYYKAKYITIQNY